MTEKPIDQPARRYVTFCREIGEACPRCACQRHYALKDGRRRCPECGYTYHLLTGRFLNGLKISLSKWDALIRAFAAGVSANKAARRLRMKYDTVQKGYSLVRLALACELGGTELFLDDEGGVVKFCPNLAREDEQAICEGCRAYVFRLDGLGAETVRCRAVVGLKAREVLASPVPKRVWRHLIHADVPGERDSTHLFGCCRRGRKLFTSSTDKPIALDAVGDFKAFADGWLGLYRCFTPEAYPLYLAEVVFRYNNRHQELAPLIAQRMCGFVPKRGE
jgi:transposase